MTSEAQRIAIAKACPKLFEVRDGEVYCINDIMAVDPLNDLNAMHEAEKMLLNSNKGVDWLTYTNHLIDLTNLDYETHAPAAQRAEAFLRTLGLWNDDACPQSKEANTAKTSPKIKS